MKETIKIIGYCSKYVDGQGWTTEVPVKELERLGFTRKEPKPIAYCERCGKPIYEGIPIDGVYYCEDCENVEY